MNASPAAPRTAVAGGTAEVGGTAAGGLGDSVADDARKALRRVASGVTVLTVANDGRPHGTTVSAIVAVSRDPLVLAVCLRTASAFSEFAARSGVFTVNVLSGAQESVAVRFAAPGRRPGAAQFAGLRHGTDPRTGAPVIADCLAHLSCRLVRAVPVGDHDVLFADVIAGSSGPGIPLLTFAGRMHHAPTLHPERNDS